MVPRRGLEPPRLAAPVPETGASTNSAIWACAGVVTPSAGSSATGGKSHYPGAPVNWQTTGNPGWARVIQFSSFCFPGRFGPQTCSPPARPADANRGLAGPMFFNGYRLGPGSPIGRLAGGEQELGGRSWPGKQKNCPCGLGRLGICAPPRLPSHANPA